MMDDRWLWCGGVLSRLLTHSYLLTLTSVLRYAVHSHEEKKGIFLSIKCLNGTLWRLVCIFWYKYVWIWDAALVKQNPQILSSLSPCSRVFFFIHGLHLRHVEKCAIWQETKASDNHILPYSWLSRDQNMSFCSDFSTWCHDFINWSENLWPVQQWIINCITAGYFFTIDAIIVNTVKWRHYSKISVFSFEFKMST